MTITSLEGHALSLHEQRGELGLDAEDLAALARTVQLLAQTHATEAGWPDEPVIITAAVAGLSATRPRDRAAAASQIYHQLHLMTLDDPEGVGRWGDIAPELTHHQGGELRRLRGLLNNADEWPEVRAVVTEMDAAIQAQDATQRRGQ